MKSSQLTKVALPILIILVIVFGLRFGIQQLLLAHDTATITTIDEAIKSQLVVVVETADLTRQNVADQALEKIIVDCNTSDRQRFDTLLDSLQKNISAVELNELTILFYKCGYFYAERKGVMAARLDREIETLKNLYALRTQIQPLTGALATEIDTWKNIAIAEQKWATYSKDLVEEQGAIIDLLRAGKTTTSTEVAAILTKASNARSQMEILGTQIQGYRQSIQSI